MASRTKVPDFKAMAELRAGYTHVRGANASLEKQMHDRAGYLSPWFEQFILWNTGRPHSMQILATHGPLQP